MSQSRRYFLKSSGLAMASLAAAPSFLVRTAMAQGSTSSKDRPILIAIFQRGAADGVSVVPPFGDRNYAKARPQIAVPEPGRNAAESAIDLDGFFGFHPALSPLKPIYDEGQLAVVHAVGSPDTTRSHFDAQDYMEAGAPGNKGVPDGWLNRYLQGAKRADATAFRAIALDAKMPRTLMGTAPALALARIQDFDVRGPNAKQGGGSSSELYAAFEAMWRNSTFDAVKMLKNANPQRFQPENGARYPGGQFGQSLLQMSQLIKADIGLEVGFLDIGGWDTHANQPGQLNQRLREYGEGLSAFYRDLGDRMRNIVVLTMTEFGRSIRQNGSGGTDHGHASALFVMGGPVKGRKVYGKWPGLAPEQLYEGRDLALTTDFRDVFAEVLKKHLGAADTARVFPGWQPGQPLGIL
ncbi:MAG TPA: DUF1501 domain-containing protein [Terriglobia bacterium]|nr:DUF1501 domain-containing protein [Terriglobia bacterium]